MPDPTPDELFGQTATAPNAPVSRLPTVNELFSTPQAGAAHDSVWSSITDAGARVLDAAGWGGAQPWQGRPVGLDPDTEASLRKSGVLPDYQSGHTTWLQSAAEAVIRPAAQIGDMLWNAPAAAAGAYTEAARQASAELGGEAPGALHAVPNEQQARIAGQIVSATTGGAVTPATLEASAELASGVTKGYYPELAEEGIAGGNLTAAAARSARAADAAAARAVGALGEGEAGYYEAAPLSQENATARVNAATEAGVEPTAPLAPAPDVHALARRIDPETFGEYDALNAESALHRDTITRLAAERAALPEAVEAQGQIDTIMGRVNNVPSRLTNAARARMEAAQSRLDTILNTDTPEMAAARDALLSADYRMRELAPDVSTAYRYAREMAPELPETAIVAAEQPARAAEAEKQGAPPAAAEMAAVSEGRQREVAAAGAAPAAQAEVAPPNVVGEKLGTEPVAAAQAPVAEAAETAGVEAAATVLDEKSLRAELAQHGDDVGALGRDVVSRVEQALSEGRAVTLYNEGKPVQIVSTAGGRLRDAEGKPWGIQPLLQQVPGENSRLEIGGSSGKAAPEVKPPSDTSVAQAARDVEEHRGPKPPRTTIMQAIKSLGGLKVRDEEGRPTPGPDVQGALADFKNKPPGVINNKTGLTPERMHEALAEQGWFGHGNVDDEALVRAIQKQAAGEDVFHPESGLAEAHARRAALDEEMGRAGISAADSPATATAKLADWRAAQAKMATEMEALRVRADALGIEHTPATAYDELLAEVVEREAIQGEADAHDFDDYERSIATGLTPTDLAELDRLAATGLEAEHGEGAGAFSVPAERGLPAGAAEGAAEPAAGAGGGGHGPPAAGGVEPGAVAAGGGAGELEPVAGTGETVTRGLAAHVEATAIEQGIAADFGDLPEYQRVSMADQARQAADLIASDPDAARAIAMGERAPPSGLLPESVFVAVEKKALAEGDVETLRGLATQSRLTTAATTMGQRIRTLGERDPTSPVAAIQAVQAARERAAGAGLDAARTATEAEIKAVVRAAASKPDVWEALVNNLLCAE